MPQWKSQPVLDLQAVHSHATRTLGVRSAQKRQWEGENLFGGIWGVGSTTGLAPAQTTSASPGTTASGRSSDTIFGWVLRRVRWVGRRRREEKGRRHSVHHAVGERGQGGGTSRRHREGSVAEGEISHMRRPRWGDSVKHDKGGGGADPTVKADAGAVLQQRAKPGDAE
eukprot:GGOE01037797.1.p3 GENE.GGOE01037797.1~~GGOE01037797.1.p3  ORF type:complete len:169 (-),score=1.07 GGOE01037797.1:813-1319(-)